MEKTTRVRAPGTYWCRYLGFVMPTPTAGPVSWQLAKTWRLRFKEHNPKGTWGHFWGRNAVEQLLAQGTEQVRIELGINDAGSQQLMFSNAADPAPSVVYDRTGPCPPYCSDENQNKIKSR